MNKQTVFNALLILVAVGLVTIIIQSVPETQALLNSPLPTPVPSPSPTSGPFVEARKAMDYLAQREKTAPENLVVVNEFRREASLLGRTFQAVTVLDLESGRFFQVLVDLNSGQVEDRVAIEEAEEQRHRAKYGKLRPALCERLQAMRDDEVVTVTIWVAAGPGQSLAEQEVAAMATLAARYSEARAALAAGGKPMDVDDPELAERIYAEYVDLLETDLNARVQPLVATLEAQGFAVSTSTGLPAVTATLPKGVITLLAEQDDVGVIYLAEGGFRRALNSAVPTNRTPTVWERGYDGTGVDIAILEDDNVDFTSPGGSECPSGDNCFRHPGATQGGVSGVDWHATLVASAAASDQGTYRGMAPGATVMSAGMQGFDYQDGIDALTWALDHGAEVVNVSGGWCTGSTQMTDIDRAFDHYARARNRLFVAATHNSPVCGNYIVASPAKGWNVLSVGAYDDHNNSNWSDDEMADFSTWHNPDSPNDDHEKPEVVAPGVEIVGIGLNGQLVTDPNLNSGTSFAAPQVTGLAALLIDRYWSLNVWPEASRAIIMASAVHNIEGPSGILSGQDLKDGAGGIDAALADITAQTRWTSATSPCTGPCWWGFSINNSSFPVGTYLYRYFNASRGERVRVAISWWSHADCPAENNCNFDRLDTDLHLGVKDPDNQWVDNAWSASWDNNYELIEFIAPKTGQYEIAIYKERADESSNYLGIAWVRDATYLPDLRNKDGWVSEFYVCNEGAEPRSQYNSPPNPVYVYYSDTNGNPTPKNYDQCDLNPNGCCWIPVNEFSRIPAGTTGSAIVSGGEDVTVVVEHQKNNNRERTNYTGILPEGSSGSPGWEQTGSTLYAPLIKRGFGGRSSTLQVLNAGNQATTVYVYYYDSAGTSRLGGSYALDANEQVALTPSGAGSGGCHAAGTLCAARLYTSNGQPLAGVVLEDRDSDGLAAATHNLFSAGGSTLYVPAFKYNLNGMYSGVQVQNVGASSANISVRFYDSSGNHISACDQSASGVAPYAGRTFANLACPGNGFLGSAEVSSSGQALVGMASEASADGRYKKSFAAFLGGAPTAYGAPVYRTYSQDGYTWDAGIAVQNLSAQSASVNLYYYNLGGTLVGSQTNQSLNGRGLGVFFAPVSHFKGALLITANRDIAAIVNVAHNAGSGDTHAIYNASNC